MLIIGAVVKVPPVHNNGVLKFGYLKLLTDLEKNVMNRVAAGPSLIIPKPLILSLGKVM